MKSPILDYPCSWVYKVIGSDREAIGCAVNEILQDRSCSLTPSRSSRTGKYHCMDLEVMVHSDEDRTTIYALLKKHPVVKIVL